MEVRIYMNKRNNHKFLEVHDDGYRHISIRQYMKMPGMKANYNGDGCLHRWSKANLVELLEDYKMVARTRKTRGGDYEVFTLSARNEDGYYSENMNYVCTYGKWYKRDWLGKVYEYRVESNPYKDAVERCISYGR